MIEALTKFYEEYKNEIHEGVFFSAFVMFGSVVKIIRAIQQGSKLSFGWFFTETILSFFIAIIVYAVFDQFLNFKPFFTYSICALLGSMSTVLHKKTEELLESIFDSFKAGVRDFVAALIDKFKSK